MTEVSSLTSWIFQQEIPIPQDVANLMVPGEQPVAAYATFRDSAIFTTKRLIVRDAQGFGVRRWRCIRCRIRRSTCGRQRTRAQYWTSLVN